MGKEEIILKFEHVVKRFGGITASNDINIDVPKGSIYGIIGPNGAGKTTLFNTEILSHIDIITSM